MPYLRIFLTMRFALAFRLYLAMLRLRYVTFWGCEP